MTSAPPKKFPPEILHLDEQIGEFMEYWGFKRIHGRVWLHLYLSTQPLDVAEIMGRLGVSKALMSFCIRDLREYGVIQEAGVGRHGTVLFKANPNLSAVIQNVLRSRERPLLARIRASQELALSLPPAEKETHRIDPERLRELGQMVLGAEQILQALAHGDSSTPEEAGGVLELLNLLGSANPD